MAHNEYHDTVVIGAGQAGLAISHLLTEQGRDHLIVDKADEIGGSWRQRWDSFTLVTPNWWLQMPGRPYRGDDPEGFLSRDEVVEYLEEYAASFDPPLRLRTEVTSVEPGEDGEGYLVHTHEGTMRASNVVVAAGTFQEPAIPPIAEDVPAGIVQMHSSEYESPANLRDGAVLVVGSGQSGCQIAQELFEAGREVYLATGKAPRLPRTYRGKDGMWWAHRLGMMDETVEDLDSPEQRFAANPQISGKGGGREIDLHEFARDGITLLGHLEGFRDGTAVFAGDLHENLEMGDQSATMIRKGADEYVETTGMDLPEEAVDQSGDGYRQDEIAELDLAAAGVAAIIWATGFRWDFSWVQAPVFDEAGYPVQRQGVTESPGLYFLGLHFLHTRKSGLLLGITEDAAHVAAHIAGRPLRDLEPAGG